MMTREVLRDNVNIEF